MTTLDPVADILSSVPDRAMRAWVIPLLIGLGSCHPSQRPKLTCAEAANPKLVIQRCFPGEPNGGRYIGDLACFPFSAPQRLIGIWHVELEGSYFSTSQAEAQAGKTSLEVPNPPRLAVASMQGDVPRDFAVEVIGRHSLCDMGVPPNIVIVEKLLSIRLVSAIKR